MGAGVSEFFLGGEGEMGEGEGSVGAGVSEFFLL